MAVFDHLQKIKDDLETENIKIYLSGDPVLTGWLGMSGLLFLLHFGLFEWVAAFWNTSGCLKAA